jgi:hypothetical protein
MGKPTPAYADVLLTAKKPQLPGSGFSFSHHILLIEGKNIIKKNISVIYRAIHFLYLYSTVNK